MAKKILMVFLVVASISANAAFTLKNTDDTLNELPYDVNEVLERGLYVYDVDDNMVELTDEDDRESVAETGTKISKLVFFYLYTKENPTVSQELVPGDSDRLHSTNWNASRLTRIVTHGWQNSGTSQACTLIRDAYLENGDYNVIIVDWSQIARWTYGYSRRRVGIVGTCVGAMIDFLNSHGMDASLLVVVGHSLGAHVAGLSSRKANSTVGCVVALDPAGPLFGSSGPGERVDKTDALNVQVIHTNGGALGLNKNVGHMDFYPNGGARQTGCAFIAIGCSHSRAYEYFAESINTNVGFQAQLCESWSDWQAEKCTSANAISMGGSLPARVSSLGSYYLATADKSPYALGHS